MNTPLTAFAILLSRHVFALTACAYNVRIGNKKNFGMTRHFFAAFVFSFLFVTSAPAAQCGSDFRTFIGAMSREAAGRWRLPFRYQLRALGRLADQSVLAFDRRRRGTSDQLRALHLDPGRPAASNAEALMQRHAALLARIQRQFGVPVTWCVRDLGPRTDFGSGDIGSNCR